MIKKITLITTALATLLVSCAKESRAPDVQSIATSTIKVPAGFTWENSRNVNLTLSVADSESPNKIHVISVYDGDPADGGNLLTKGSALTTSAFKSKIYLSNQITAVYLVGAFPDGTSVTNKQTITGSDLAVTISK